MNMKSVFTLAKFPAKTRTILPPKDAKDCLPWFLGQRGKKKGYTIDI